jgi:hypothetical protein
LSDGTTGWVKSAYLTTKEPALVRVKQLEEELDRSRATPPGLAEAAARTEVDQLKLELRDKQAQIDAARGTVAPAPSPAVSPRLGSGALTIIGASAALGLICGFWLGYATLARRVKHKFGGIKVY